MARAWCEIFERSLRLSWPPRATTARNYTAGIFCTPSGKKCRLQDARLLIAVRTPKPYAVSDFAIERPEGPFYRHVGSSRFAILFLRRKPSTATYYFVTHVSASAN